MGEILRLGPQNFAKVRLIFWQILPWFYQIWCKGSRKAAIFFLIDLHFYGAWKVVVGCFWGRRRRISHQISSIPAWENFVHVGHYVIPICGKICTLYERYEMSPLIHWKHSIPVIHIFSLPLKLPLPLYYYTGKTVTGKSQSESSKTEFATA